ncbi:MAG: hypothetical protein LBO72_08175 [Helicobacteraceae bacterium]|nr:hypothetical protein [Helicobacteraceae bacterium]
METVVAVVIVGILAAIAIASSYEPDRLALAQDQIVRHIRYTQHLSVMDDKFDPQDPNWRLRKWRLRFGHHANPIYVGGLPNGWSYTIFADKDPEASTAPSISEIALDPHTKLLLSGGFNDSLKTSDRRATPEMALWHWRVKELQFTGCNQIIGFDEMGRPYNMSNSASGTTSKILTTTCKITLKDENDDTASVCVEPETGWTHEC